MGRLRIRLHIIALAAALSFACGAARAAGDATPEQAADPVLQRAAAATARQDWTGAQAALREGLSRNPANAEYHNLYAYAVRKGPSPDMGLVFKHYQEALRLDPQHRGAHEYIGEAYLLVGDLAKAKAHLAVLDKLCFFPCEEYTELKQAIAAFEGKRSAR